MNETYKTYLLDMVLNDIFKLSHVLNEVLFFCYDTWKHVRSIKVVDLWSVFNSKENEIKIKMIEIKKVSVWAISLQCVVNMCRQKPKKCDCIEWIIRTSCCLENACDITEFQQKTWNRANLEIFITLFWCKFFYRYVLMIIIILQKYCLFCFDCDGNA